MFSQGRLQFDAASMTMYFVFSSIGELVKTDVLGLFLFVFCLIAAF